MLLQTDTIHRAIAAIQEQNKARNNTIKSIGESGTEEIKRNSKTKPHVQTTETVSAPS